MFREGFFYRSVLKANAGILFGSKQMLLLTQLSGNLHTDHNNPDLQPFESDALRKYSLKKKYSENKIEQTKTKVFRKKCRFKKSIHEQPLLMSNPTRFPVLTLTSILARTNHNHNQPINKQIIFCCC